MTTILFVCTGNTCRSPMAACMMNHLLQEAGLTQFRALSAGTDAWDGQMASTGASNAMKSRKLLLIEHRSQSVTQELLDQVQLVYCVSQRHADTLRRRFSKLPPVQCFSPAIPDPFGGTDEEYERCAAAMEVQLIALLEQLRTASGH